MSRSHCYCDKLTYKPQVNWFERLLLKLIPHFDIIKTIVPTWEGHPCSPQTVLYLRRFYIWRSKWVGKNWGDLYLHKIYRSDDDKDPHTHPWNFRTWVLWGGYEDEAWMFDKAIGSDTSPAPYGRRRRVKHFDELLQMGNTRKRYRGHIHRVQLFGGPAWTLVWTTGYKYDKDGNGLWHFVTEDRLVPWRVYLGLTNNEEHGE